MEAIKEHLKELVNTEAKDLLVVTKEIKEIIKHDTKYLNDIIILEGTIKDTLYDKFVNIYPKEDIDISVARIRGAILSIIDKIEKNDIKAQSIEMAWWDGIPYEWEKAFEYLIGNRPSEKGIKFLFKVKELNVKSEYITDLNLISNFKQIEKLTLDLPNVKDYSHINNLPSIKAIIINTGQIQLNLSDIISKSHIEYLWLNSTCRVGINNIVAPRVFHVSNLRIANYDIPTLKFLNRFEKIDTLIIEECEIGEMNFSLLDEKKILNLEIDLNFDDDETVWTYHESITIKEIKVVRNKRLDEFKLNKLFDSLPKLKVIRIAIENFYSEYYKNLETEDELPVFLTEAIKSNVSVIDFSNTILYSDSLILALSKQKICKKIILNKYDYKKHTRLKKENNISPVVEFELNESISF